MLQLMINLLTQGAVAMAGVDARLITGVALTAGRLVQLWLLAVKTYGKDDEDG